MKLSKKTLFSLLALSLMLTACGAPSMAGMPGLVVDGDTVYTSYGTDVSAVRVQDGVMVWRFPAAPDARFFFAQPEIAENLIVVGDYSNVLYGVDRGNGQEKWAFKGSASRWVSSALVVGDTVLAPSSDGNLYALDMNGTQKWLFAAGHAFWTKPLSDGRVIYAASLDHKLYAIDLSTGKEKWQVDLGSAIVRTPLLDQGVIYAGTLGGELIAVETTSQKILWRFKAEGAIWFTPAIQDGVVYFGDVAGKMYAVKADNAEVVWKVEAGSAVMGGAAFTPDGVIFCAENGNVIATSFTGEKMWFYSVPGKLYTGPVVANDRIIVAVTEGETLLVGLDFRGGKQWSFLPPKQ